MLIKPNPESLEFVWFLVLKIVIFTLFLENKEIRRTRLVLRFCFYFKNTKHSILEYVWLLFFKVVLFSKTRRTRNKGNMLFSLFYFFCFFVLKNKKKKLNLENKNGF